MSPLVSCKSLTKSYRGNTVLQPISFELAPTEALLVTGPNGSGKTTLLSILAGLVQSGSGELTFLNTPLTPFEHGLRGKIGYSPASENSLFLNASVRENLVFWAALQGLNKKSQKLIPAIADEWGFAHYLDRPVRELSSGFRRRVALARAFLHDPSLVLLDEPFAFLDNENLIRAVERLEAWLNEKRGVLVVSSNVDFLRGPKWKSINLTAKTQ
jgi:lipooligosaccharide transport system ATP-binding protein